MKLHLIELPSQSDGYVTSDWGAWIRKCLPAGLAQVVHDRLVSNLKHILVGLEMKAAFVVPHAKRGNDAQVVNCRWPQDCVAELAGIERPNSQSAAGVSVERDGFEMSRR